MKIAILPGDGIGTEIVTRPAGAGRARPEGRDRACPRGRRRLRAHGHPLPESTLALAKAADAVLFSAVGDWKYDKLERALRPEQAIPGCASRWASSPTSGRRSAIRSSPRPEPRPSSSAASTSSSSAAHRRHISASRAASSAGRRHRHRRGLRHHALHPPEIERSPTSPSGRQEAEQALTASTRPTCSEIPVLEGHRTEVHAR
jgi:hypothetical protein